MARKERRYHYIYKITCLKNNRYYIGMHSTDNLEDGYFGGGKRIKNSVKKHGKDAHRKEILEFFENRDLLRQREIELVNEELLNDPLCMNLQPGGGGGFINEDHKKKWIMSGSKAGNESIKNLSKDPDWVKKISSNTKKLWENEDLSKKMILGLEKYRGTKHRLETKIIIGLKNSISQKGEKNSQFGKKWMNNGLHEIIINSIDVNYYKESGYTMGRIKKNHET
jgi:hypothetical protein